MQIKHIAGVSFAALAALALYTSPVQATPPYGVTIQAFRNPIAVQVKGMQLEPRFFLFIEGPQSAESDSSQNVAASNKQRLVEFSNDVGYDIIQTTNVFAPVDAQGKPSTSGWHDHPAPVGFVQIIQGALWTQEAPDFTCLTYHPMGSVLTEHRGDIHDAFNLDPNVPTILRTTFFLDHNEKSLRTDQPDQVTGNPTVAAPPPTRLCQ